DVSIWGAREKQIPASYMPLPAALQFWPGFSGQLVVRSSMTPENAMGTIRKTLTGLDSSLASFQPRTMDEVIDSSIQDAGLQSYLLGSFAALALLLSAIGLYSVLAYLVTQRTREIGIRMALGAQRTQVLTMVIQHGLTLTAVGLGLGVVGSLAIASLVESLLY